MEKITKHLQSGLLSIILMSTIIAVGIEIKAMCVNQIVSLADLLLMFLYFSFPKQAETQFFLIFVFP